MRLILEINEILKLLCHTFTSNLEIISAGIASKEGLK